MEALVKGSNEPESPLTHPFVLWTEKLLKVSGQPEQSRESGAPGLL